MKNLDRVKSLISQLEITVMSTNFKIEADYDKKAALHLKLYNIEPRVYIQVIYKSPCSKTGKLSEWKGRKHYLSDHMTDDEVIKTAYVAVKMAVEHEVMEGFRFNDQLIFNPHTPYTELIKASTVEQVRESHWTYEKFAKISNGEVFATGETFNSPEGYYVTDNNISDKLRWVAKKGEAGDWAMYGGWATSTVNQIKDTGDKVHNLEVVKKLLDCDEEMLKHYRR